jgi:hypothetical protein
LHDAHQALGPEGVAQGSGARYGPVVGGTMKAEEYENITPRGILWETWMEEGKNV